MKARKRLAEWSNTPEGKAHYEKVANEMREQMTNQEIDKWVEDHVDAPEGSKHKSSVIEWGKIVAHKFFMKGVAEGRRLEREEMEENKRKEDELPRFYGD